MKLLTFCHAGGHAPSYLPLKKRLAAFGVNAILLELPGRGMRSKEQLLTSMEAVLDDYQRQSTPHMGEPFAFYGHSMGALVAHLMTLRLLDRRLPTPAHVFLSSKPIQTPAYNPSPRYLLSDEDFKSYLASFGSPRTMLDDPDLMKYLANILRADFRAIETCDHREDEAYDIPITGMVADEDLLTVEQARQWQNFSHRPMSLYTFKGNHFYTLNNWADIARIIALRLPEALSDSEARGYV